jgi:glycosyltransferase involved in cell wall biosynthesis
MSALQAKPLSQLKVAIVHEWFTTMAGSEKVVEQLIALFPQADLYALVDHLPAGQRGFLRGKTVRTSFLQRVPFSATLFRKLLWILPSAIETFDLSQYDLVLSSSHAVAKGILTGPRQLHICYCHSPIRYAWDMQHEYLRGANLEKGIMSIYARATLHYLRMWDVRSANGVDHFVANSRFIARRIQKVYRRDSTVVFPPVDVDSFPLETEKDDYYITASRLVPYKRVDLIVEAFGRMPQRRLLVIGEGPDLDACKKLARTNVQFLGYQEGAVLQRLMSKGRGFLFAGEEDFGIIIVEAQACGTPVICFRAGGALDSVLEKQTGLFFDRQSPESICDAVERFENLATPLDAFRIRAHAEQFSIENFRRNFFGLVQQRWADHALDIDHGPTMVKVEESFANTVLHVG